MFDYAKLLGWRKATPQSEPIPGTVPNSAGGHAFPVDDWMRLERFLVLGSEGGSYYATERKLTRENAEALCHLLEVDGERVVATIVAMSRHGRAPKNDPAIFALAVAAASTSEATRKRALAAIPEVCRTGTHLFQFVEAIEQFRGWGRGLRSAVGRWYVTPDVAHVAYQAVKYRQRGGWSHRDLLRLAHPETQEPARRALFDWIVRGTLAEDAPPIVRGFAAAQGVASPAEAARLVREHDLPREALPTEVLNDVEVWRALLARMPMTAMVRNLAKLTAVGALAPMSDGLAAVRDALGDAERVRRARLHPMALLVALRTYAAGRGEKGSLTWHPVPQVVDALNAAFYTAFRAVRPTGKRILLALDVSGSMGLGGVAGSPLTPREAAAAMALVTAATEERWHLVGFASGTGAFTGGTNSGLVPLPLTPSMRLDDVVRRISDLPFAGTDCALPMLYATAKRIPVDAFVIYTDSETWAGEVHPVQALREYRQRMGIAAKLVVVGLVSNGFTIADPDDAGMLDVVGFDTAAPAVIADFIRGGAAAPEAAGED